MGGLRKVMKKGLGEMGFNMGGGAINWFPGHMAAATRAIRDRLKLSDLVIEVRDARIPLSSANGDLQPLLSGKRRVIALNKKDLANPNIMHVQDGMLLLYSVFQKYNDIGDILYLSVYCFKVSLVLVPFIGYLICSILLYAISSVNSAIC